MAVQSSISNDLISRNKDSEPKKKLKKTRSIRLSKVPSLKPSSRRPKSRFNWLSIDLNDSSSLLDFSDACLDHMKETNSSDAKKDTSQQGGSDIDDSTSVESSSNGSPALSSLNQTTRIQKMLQNYKVSGSFRRHAKSRTVQPNVGSPNYLKATSSSDGRKTNSQASSRDSSSCFESFDTSSSHVSTPKSVKKSSQILATTPSMKSVRIQLNKTSLKPKRASYKGSHNSQDLNVDRATCSSTFKDKKFPDQVELSSDGNSGERKSALKVCPYQHCSLHGHNRDAAPKNSWYKIKSLKQQKNKQPELKSASEANVPGGKRRENFKLTSEMEFSRQDLGAHGAVCTAGKKEKDVFFSVEIHAKIKAQFSNKTNEETGESEASEVTLGESSCFLESQKDGLKEMMNALIKSLSDLKEKSVACRCKSKVHEPSNPLAQENSAVGNIPASSTRSEEHEPTMYNQNEDHFVANVTDLQVNLESQVNEPKFDDGAEKRNLSRLFQDCDIGLTEPRKTSTVKDHHSTESLDTRAGDNTRNTLEPVLTLGRDIDAKKPVPVDDPQYSSRHEGFRAKLSGGKNISMWQLIQKQMTSSLASDVEESLPQTENEENQVEDTNKAPALSVSADTEKREDKDNQGNDKMDQVIELRKALAIKLVREAIEKILLPEISDQSSDDQSTTSETTSEQDLSEQIHAEEYLKERKKESGASNDSIESGPSAGSKDQIQQVRAFKKLEDKSEKKAPKHWSNLKKWIILQRFVKALETLKTFNPRGPRCLELEPEPEGEKVALRPPSVDEKKNAEEWMYDYALRQAINQLAPTQKKKVSLLVKAFETVVPPQEDSDIHSTISKLKEASGKSRIRTYKHEDTLPEGNDMKPGNLASPLTGPKSNSSIQNEATNFCEAMVETPHELLWERNSHQEISGVGISNVDAPATCANPSPSSSDTIVEEGGCKVINGTPRLPHGQYLVEPTSNNTEEEKKNHIKMWHMVYHHVVSSIVEKVGPKLLDGTDEDSEDTTELPKFLKTDQYRELETYEALHRNGFSRTKAVELVQEAVDEILLPEIQDDLSETHSVTSDTVSDQDLLENTNGKSGTKFEQESKTTVDNTALQETLKQNICIPQKMKNWRKLKKLVLLQRSVRALEKARKPKSQLQNFMQSEGNPHAETVDLRSQMMDEKKKAEEWMLDYAVRNIVHTLTPARERRVALLVEAFEAVVPLPKM